MARAKKQKSPMRTPSVIRNDDDDVLEVWEETGASSTGVRERWELVGYSIGE